MASMGMKGMITVSANSINQIVATAYSIDLYPNPVTNGEFTVKTEGNIQQGKIMLYNEEGKLLETHNLEGASTSVKTKLPSGVYFYTVMVGTNAVKKGKFLVNSAK
ncbi:MAG TPA: T9SS type A sorting domain-containing protein [Bacteroidia bacterium]|jgi:hypothetical protein|nr:T9SS type A sorting domain-containing protein [Bacteroidia bacterium]